MDTKVTVDKFGRVLLPKRIREKHGLAAGSEVTVHDGRAGILLKPPADEEAGLIRKNGVLLYHGGRLPKGFDLLKFLQQEREGRINEIIGRSMGPDKSPGRGGRGGTRP